MRSRITYLLGVLAASGLANHAWAVAIPIQDPSFDFYIHGTTTPYPNDRSLSSGNGSRAATGVAVVNFDTFAPAPEGSADIPAGWTASGVKPNGITPVTGRLRCDTCFLNQTGSVAVINSNHQVDANGVGPPGMFSQTLTGVSAQPNTVYTATIEVSDLNITNRGPFQPPDDNLILGNPGHPPAPDPGAPPVTDPPTEPIPANNQIHLLLTAGGASFGTITEQFSDITPNGGFLLSGGKSLLTLTVLTGPTVPSGNLTIAFTAEGSIEYPHGFAPSAQTFFDNVTLDATPFGSPSVPGDYNKNGVVDAADYVLWRNGGPLQNEVSSLGTVDAQDYTAWRARFGNTSGSGSGLGSSGAVPEPASICMLASGLLAVGFVRNRMKAV
jgi:hypothetical protein